MKNILLLIHDDAGQEARVQTALDLTRALDGHLKCLDVTPFNAIPGDGFGDASAVVLEYEQRQESANKRQLQQRLPAEGVSWEWMDATGYLTKCLEAAAKLADIIVLNRHLDDHPIPDMRDLASGLIVTSGVPVLAVPQDVMGFRAGGSALVAWDGSTGAAAALTAAVPLLKLAEAVTILEVEDKSVSAPAEEAATLLSQRGVDSSVLRVEAFQMTTSSVLLEHARSGKFDYLVMGGFGHSRLVEAMLGGVTRRMLTECPIPVFFAH